MNKDTKKIVFITSTRADFSKIKSLMKAVDSIDKYELLIFATGMHLSNFFGLTVKEIEKCGFKNIYKFINHDRYYQTDYALSQTISGLSKYVAEYQPNLIVVHGDRIEPLAGAIVGSLNNILVAHIEGGEKSGTIDDSLRHAISKLSHIHLVNDEQAKRRLIQLGENTESIFVIGSPDLDILNKNDIDINEVKSHYGIEYNNYAIAIFHPVTTELNTIKEQSLNFVNALIESNKQYVVIYPNNDLGFELILDSYEKIMDNKNFKLFPSLRFEYFITLLKYAEFIIGNSSCIIKEAMFLNIPGILIGSRQNGRFGSNNIKQVDAIKNDILEAINNINEHRYKKTAIPDAINSADRFVHYLDSFFDVNTQKVFKDM